MDWPLPSKLSSCPAISHPSLPCFLSLANSYTSTFLLHPLGGRRNRKSRSQRKKKMESSNCMGLVAVVAVSGSIALVALQVHRRLASDFIKKVESEIGRERNRPRKKVRFAPDVIEPSSNNEEYRRRKKTALSPPTNR
ncbi:unnamed protein product [Musa acuminata subsp. burmannicoides]